MKSSPATKAPPAERKPQSKRREGDVRHVLDKALPPGVELEDVQDPGKSYDGTPAGDRRAPVRRVQARRGRHRRQPRGYRAERLHQPGPGLLPAFLAAE